MGRPRSAVVLAAFPTALYLGFEEHSAVLPVVTSDALVLPSALRLADPGPFDWDVEPGDMVPVGRGLLALPSHGIRAVRTWRPRRVTGGDPSEVGFDWMPLLADVGRGPGLTPSADDVLCGALLAARALGIDLPTSLPLRRTTSLSASLLSAAHDGYAVACVADHVTHAVVGSPLAATTREEVLAIGHTSGEALLQGIDELINTANTPLPERISL